MLKNKKILAILIVLLIIIIAGLTVMFVKGMNYGLNYGENTTIRINIDASIEKNDIKNIVTEVFGKANNIKTVNNLDNNILITAKTSSEEQLNSLVSKINEKYGLEMTTSDLNVSYNPKIDIIDLINPYIMPVVLTSLLILVYFMFKYKKLGILKVTICTLISIIGAQILYLSVYSCTRLPINEFTMPISMMLFIVSIIILTEFFEKKIESTKKEQK